MGTIEDWAEDFRKEFYSADINVAPTLKDFLLGHLTADEAAATLGGLVAEKGSGDDLEGPLWNLWAGVNGAAKQLPAVHDRLIDLLAAFRQLPDLKRDGQVVEVWDMVVWKDLPIWGADVRENYNYPSVPNRAKLRQDETNWNAFLAKVNASGRCGPDFKCYAIWALRSALEDAPWTTPPNIDPRYDEDTKARLRHESSPQVLDGYVPPAAQWIFHAGRLIFGSADEYAASPTAGDPAAGGPLWTGKHGFCRERWDFWKRRFVWVSEQAELDASTRDVARAAADAMAEIERDAQAEA